MITTSDELISALEKAHNECLMILNGTLGQKSGTLYHYTDLNACLSILQNKKLRFTDVRYCNDPEEIGGGLKILNSIHAEMLPKYLNLSPSFAFLMTFIVHTLNLATSFDAHDEILLQKAHADIAQCGFEPDKFAYGKSYVFIACFSAKKDDLRQWMPYATDGKGVAIGFKGLDEVHDLTSENTWVLNVCYKPLEQKEQYVRNIYDKAFKVFSQMNLSLIDTFATHAFSALLMDVIACKSSNYKDEDEWRIIKVCDRKEVNMRLSFRVSDHIVRPYIEVPINPHSVLEIITGPKLEKTLNSQALSSALERFGYTKSVIGNSNISYR